ncbi:MAG: MarR family transcriptional regulator [Propioniciclava sp.]|uniref:helix-turn-helix transcriptional regulator n=1 Tax=Propioniciclava sp. TaxID=2038686 RepID=UPI0039E5483E
MTATQPHGLGPTRAQVLALLQGATDPVSVNEIAEKLGVHRNSARFHLDALVAAGYAERASAPAGALGRPPLLYGPTASAPSLTNSHLLELADTLLAYVTTTASDPVAATEEAGRTWGARAVPAGVPPCAVREGLTRELRERGFGTERDGDTLVFRRCPFRGSISPEQMPLVCAIHQGFLEGYLAASGDEFHAGKLAVGPALCTVTVTPDAATTAVVA